MRGVSSGRRPGASRKEDSEPAPYMRSLPVQLVRNVGDLSSGRSFVRAFGGWVAMVVVVCLAAGCSDKPTRRMSEFEALEFKRSALARLAEDRALLSPSLRHRFFYHPARTREKLEEALDRYIEQHRKYLEAQKAQFLGEFDLGDFDPIRRELSPVSPQGPSN